MFGTRSQRKVYNFVHADEIWKDHVIREIQSQKRWPGQWGYLLEEYEKLQENLLGIGSELEDVKDLEKTEEQQLQELSKNEVKEEFAFAPTTDDMVVWKADKISGPLGRLMQNNARGKNDIVKVLKWPREGLE